MTEQLLTAAQVAEHLQVCEKTVRRMLNRGDLHGVRVAGMWRMHPDDVPSTAPRREAPRRRRVDYGPDSLTRLLREEMPVRPPLRGAGDEPLISIRQTDAS